MPDSLPTSPTQLAGSEKREAPWTIDNSDSRIGSMESPRRSILKPSTPNPYLSPQHQRQRAYQYREFINRRVSFASSKHVRLYGKEETPNSPNHHTVQQQVSLPSASSQESRDDNDKDLISVFDKIDSPTRPRENAYLSRLTGSPMDQRKRGPDLFGSPPTQRRRLSGHLNLQDQDDSDSDSDTGSTGSLMQHLNYQKDPHHIFDDEDGITTPAQQQQKHNNDENRPPTVAPSPPPIFRTHKPVAVESQSTLGDPSSQTSSLVSPHHRPTPSSSSDHPSSSSSKLPLTSQEDDNNDGSLAFSPTSPSLPPQPLTASQQNHFSVFSLPPTDHSSVMQITQQDQLTKRTSTQVIDDFWGTEGIASPNIASNFVDRTNHSSSTTPQTTRSPPPTSPPTTTNSVPDIGSSTALPATRSASPPADSPSPLAPRPTPVPSAPKSPGSPSSFALSLAASPSNRSVQSLTHLSPSPHPPQPSTSSSFLHTLDRIQSPRAGYGSHHHRLSSPLRTPRSPAAHLQPHQPHHLLSPHRSFYLHGSPLTRPPASRLMGSPAARRQSSLAASPRYPPSPTAASHHSSPSRPASVYLDASDHSIASDFVDRIMSMHDDRDIFAEEQPEFYDSFSEDHQNMTFTEFLQNVGISFPDQQVATLQSPLSRPLSKAPVTLKEEAVAAAATLPELKLYQSLAGNIRKQIQEGLQDLQKIDDDVRENNPQFFGEYMDGEPRLRQEMESRFFANRDLAQLEANKKWMTQLKTLLDTSVQQLHDKEILEEKDRSILRDTDLYIKKHLPDLLTHQHELSRLTKEWQEREIKYKNTNHTAIMKWEKEFKEQTAILEKTKQDVIVAERSAKQIVDRVADLKQRKEDLLKAIAEAEKVIEDHPYVSERDLIDAKDNFDLCSTLCAWQSLEKSDKKLEMVLFGDLDVQIDLLKLQAHQMDAVFIGMIEARERDYGAFAELIHGLQVMSRNLWTSNQIVQNIAMYWNRLLLIQHEVTKVQRRFWIDVDCLADANDAPVDPEQRGVACAITVFSYAHQLKFVLAFQLRAKQVMNYPHSLDLTSLSIKKHYGPVSSEQLEQCAMEKIRKNGIIDLVSTINSIINETLSSK